MNWLTWMVHSLFRPMFFYFFNCIIPSLVQHMIQLGLTFMILVYKNKNGSIIDPNYCTTIKTIYLLQFRYG